MDAHEHPAALVEENGPKGDGRETRPGPGVIPACKDFRVAPAVE
jgi:hypothetical protein